MTDLTPRDAETVEPERFVVDLDATCMVLDDSELCAFERDHLAEMTRSPAYAKAYAEASAQMDRVVSRSCHWGNCVVLVDPLDNTTAGGGGPVTCPCDNLPGWNANHLEGMSRPGVPTKARGRHGSRVQRSQRRKNLPQWDDWEWTPAHSVAAATATLRS